MMVEKTHLNGVLLVKLDRYFDERGYFQETYNKEVFGQLGLPTDYVQDNMSHSKRDVIRGLHLQRNNPQGKLVRCMQGKIFDVVVDLRLNSPTFKKWGMFELRDKNNVAIYVPPGYAHGFVTISEESLVSYKCTTLYDRASDGGIRWDDEELGITWPIKSPIISAKDRGLPTMREYLERA